MNEMIEGLFGDKSLALLGFGREGRSSYTLLRRVFPQKTLAILDENDNIRQDACLQNDYNLVFITGKDCMQAIDNYDVAIKSPGIPSNTLPDKFKRVRLTSQTDIFMQCYGHQSIGVTGTKGKSTTSSIIFHILKNAGRKTLLVGNIGVPPFDCIDEITPETTIVMELSSHQLEYVAHSPHIALLLNIFQEHLDHYHTYGDYQKAKLNISMYQSANDYFIYNHDNEILRNQMEISPHPKSELISFSLDTGPDTLLNLKDAWVELQLKSGKIRLYDTSQGQPLMGHHNLYNIMAAAAACSLAGVSPEHISAGIRSFNGLEHRIEPVGTYEDIMWYNDSIATIPEAAIEAVKTLHCVDTLILGGFDRGIEYAILYPFLFHSGISNLIFIGKAGTRMMNELKVYGESNIKFFTATDYQEVVDIALRVTKKGKICLLSPAAASYDMFSNFEERGNTFKKNVRKLLSSHN